MGKTEIKKKPTSILSRDSRNKAKKIAKNVAGILGIVLKSFLWVFIVGILGLACYAAATYSRYANEFQGLAPKNNSTKNVYYDKNGEVIYEGFGASEPEVVALSDVPQEIIDATLASEDSDFYQHGAIDLSGLARAAMINIKNSDESGLRRLLDLFNEEEYSQGGSTITQQLVKNLYLSNERSFDRKIKEVVYAFEIEKKHSKDEILEMYLNNVYFGEQANGIVNASRIFYGKKIDELNLGEISMIIGLPAAPSNLSPISGDFTAAKERQRYVLSQMYYNNKITLEEAQEASQTTLYFGHPEITVESEYPYFVDYVTEVVKEKIGEESYGVGGLKIYTTLDPEVQKTVEQAAAKHIATLKWRNVTNAASVVLDNETGEIVAMMGGLNYKQSKVNVATSKRQPGSSFKPVVYTAGLLNNYTAASRLIDTRVNFGGTPPYVPRNYDGGYRGYVTVRTALANSLNVPAVEMAKLVGVSKVLKTAELLGIDSLDKEREYGLSIGLGSGEVELLDMVRAYSTFANGGQRPNPTAITRITDGSDNEIYKQPKVMNEALDPRIAYIMTSILSDNYSRRLVFGTNSQLQLGKRPVAAKTGTTDSFADNWTIGFTPQYTVGVWVGNNDHSVMRNLPGLQGAAPIWNAIMKDIHADKKILEFKKPKGLIEAWISPYTGLPTSTHRNPNILEYFMPDTVPTKNEKFEYLNQFR